jgi:hypothetical protein
MSENVDSTYNNIVRRGLDGGIKLGNVVMDGLSGVCIRFQI